MYHFENPAIVAIKSDIVTFIHVKSASHQINKSDIWFQFEKNEKKNPPDGADMQKKPKQILKLLYLRY